jgi:hypothetical protein
MSIKFTVNFFPNTNTVQDAAAVSICVVTGMTLQMLGILDQLLGPAVLHNRLTGALYIRYVFKDLPLFLGDLPLYQQHVFCT